MLCYDVICIDENCVVRVSFMIGLRESAHSVDRAARWTTLIMARIYKVVGLCVRSLFMREPMGTLFFIKTDRFQYTALLALSLQRYTRPKIKPQNVPHHRPFSLL